jgi:hypothetical protein
MTAAIGDEIKKYIQRIENENKELKHVLDENTKQRKELEAENRLLEEKLKLALFRQFSRGSERFTGEGQQSLFGNEEILEDKTDVCPGQKDIPVKSHTRKARRRKPLDPKIPRVEIPIDIAEEEKHCACGHDLVCIGEDVTERLVIVPEQVYVEQYLMMAGQWGILRSILFRATGIRAYRMTQEDRIISIIMQMLRAANTPD